MHQFRDGRRQGAPQTAPRNANRSVDERYADLPGEAEVVRLIETGDPKALVERAEKIGQILATNKLQTSQIRNVFGEVRRIEMRWPPEGATPEQRSSAHRAIQLLRPKLAYQAARHSDTPGVRMLEQVLRPAIEAVGDDRRRFQTFVDFFEAIIAYHRFHEGRAGRRREQ